MTRGKGTIITIAGSLRLGRAFRGLALSLAAFALAGSLASCTNLSNLGKGKKSGQNSGPDLGITGAPLPAQTALLSNAISEDGDLLIDIAGDGSGRLGEICAMQRSTGANNAEFSPCTCEIDFVIPGNEGNTVNPPRTRIVTPVSYVEPNLIRCNYNAAPMNMEEMGVTVRHDATSTKSLRLQYTFRSFDLVPVKRYQCREVAFIPNPLDSKVYWPQLSEDPDFNTTLNFYSTNIGGAIVRYLSNPSATPQRGGGWDCSISSVNPGISNADLILYSQGKQPDGTNLLYGWQGNRLIDRTAFHVSRGRAGIFTNPLNAYIAPSTRTDSNKPLGWAVKAVLNTITGTDQCPGTSPDPEFEWAKLWQFRAVMPERSYRIPTTTELPNVACNPGLIGYDSERGFPIYLYSTSASTPAEDRCGIAITQTGTGGRMSDRILFYGPSISEQYSSCKPVDNRADRILNLLPTNQVPSDEPRRRLDDASRSDLVYVVSPPGVHSSDMKSRSANALPYIPFRFYDTGTYPMSNCASDPNTCPNSEKIVYEPYFWDASQIEQTGPQIFPMCVLVPKGGS